MSDLFANMGTHRNWRYSSYKSMQCIQSTLWMWV